LTALSIATGTVNITGNGAVTTTTGDAIDLEALGVERWAALLAWD
jgi:hypothetical protein